MKLTEVPGGWMATCPDCRWERFGTRRAQLDRAMEAHACPKPRANGGAA